MNGSSVTRRTFIKTTAAGAAALAVPHVLAVSRLDELRIGVIGCGGRGTGAAINSLEADPAARIVALADAFRDRLDGSRNHLTNHEAFSARVAITDDRCYTGFDAYKQLLANDDIDMVILATPPGFRPMHFDAAITAGKHVFMEKPVAVDPAGVRMVIDAAKRAKHQKLSVVAGTQRRHENSYRAAMSKVVDGSLGELIAAQCYWNQGGLWVHHRKPEYSDMEWQMRNWLYFCWLSGDHICEQHVHNLDVINWAAGETPSKCMGMGGRQVRTGEEYGNIFDHFAVQYEYPSGLSLTSMCRQIDGTASRVDEVIIGTKGKLHTRPGYADLSGENPWRFATDNPNPYVQEHRNLIASIRGTGDYLNEASRIAESSLTAIMGRISAYTGKEITWEQALNSELDLSPPAYAWTDLSVRPVPVPGRS